MAMDFDSWTKEYGGAEAVKALEDAAKQSKEYEDVPDGNYICKLEKLELGENKSHKPMVKGMFRILEGKHKKQCLFINQTFCRSESGSVFPIHKGLEFLRSLKIFDDSEVDFNGDYRDFNELLLDMSEEAEGMQFEIKKSMDGDYTRLTVLDVIE